VIDERTEELASAYVLGALEPDEMQALERELEGNAELRSLVSSLRGVGALLAGTAPAMEPTAALRARLLADFIEGRPTPSTARRVQLPALLPWALAAGLAALCLLFGWQLHGLRAELEARQVSIDTLNRVADQLHSQTDDLRQTVLTLQQSNRLANLRIAVLNAQLSSDPKAVAVSVWDNEHQNGVVIVHHLKPPPKGKDYQLWIIDPHYPVPVSAGILPVDDAGDGRADFKARRTIQNANQFAVTEEVKGGAEVPTLKAMVLAGA
jgi:anti-sigma-K factor RskA